LNGGIKAIIVDKNLIVSLKKRTTGYLKYEMGLNSRIKSEEVVYICFVV
jgi:hypothetical protein